MRYASVLKQWPVYCHQVTRKSIASPDRSSFLSAQFLLGAAVTTDAILRAKSGRPMSSFRPYNEEVIIMLFCGEAVNNKELRKYQ
jgi:hypothetical protein